MNLINGNCLEEMKKMEAKSVDMIFCDLPYGQTSCKWDCCIDLQEFWKQVMRVKKTNTPIIMTTTTKFGVSLINSAPKKCPFRYDLIWCKSAPCGFLSAKKMPMRKHEMIYVFYEKLPFYDLSSHKHKFIKEKEDLDEKYKNKGGLYSKISRNGLLKTEPHYEPPLPDSLLEIKSTRGKHSTEKPVQLIEWILKYYSKEGDLILDPTMGSGSCGVACKNMNRKFIGFELDEEIFKVAQDRCGIKI
jgi:site-specific DNA-methyltransferase (adenine-specific)